MSVGTPEATAAPAVLASVNLFALMQGVDLSRPLPEALGQLLPGEKVVGVMSDDLKRVYWVRLDLDAKAKGITAQALEMKEAHVKAHHADGAEHNDEECDAYKQQVLAKIDERNSIRKHVNSLTSILQELMALEFAGAIEEAQREGIANLALELRDGYQVVVVEEDSFLQSLDALFGDPLMRAASAGRHPMSILDLLLPLGQPERHRRF
jgi:hypothetical protein